MTASTERWYTAEYDGRESKTFRAITARDAAACAKTLGYGAVPTALRLATEGEIEGARIRYERDVAGLYR